jgi:hypothetical protein
MHTASFLIDYMLDKRASERKQRQEDSKLPLGYVEKTCEHGIRLGKLCHQCNDNDRYHRR